ncbi:hypothetical protein F5Y11DRAFT_287358 [Daldinia sp. FL1419]|nr:hypothetical protein F5Y11DRAFT_287358 [Daldinia sp. FL1419]
MLRYNSMTYKQRRVSCIFRQHDCLAKLLVSRNRTVPGRRTTEDWSPRRPVVNITSTPIDGRFGFFFFFFWFLFFYLKIQLFVLLARLSTSRTLRCQTLGVSSGHSGFEWAATLTAKAYFDWSVGNCGDSDTPKLHDIAATNFLSQRASRTFHVPSFRGPSHRQNRPSWLNCTFESLQCVV